MIGEEYIDKEYIYITHTHVGCIEPPRPPPPYSPQHLQVCGPGGERSGHLGEPPVAAVHSGPPGTGAVGRTGRSAMQT